MKPRSREQSTEGKIEIKKKNKTPEAKADLKFRRSEGQKEKKIESERDLERGVNLSEVRRELKW